MILWLLIAMTLISEKVQSQTFLRQNYGSTFKQLLKTRLYTHTWVHDFVVALPRYDPNQLTAVSRILSGQSHNCDSLPNLIDAAMCRDDMATLSSLQQLRYATVHSLQDAIARVHSILPPATTINHLRTTKRAVIAGVGSGLHWLFGTATDDEIDAEEKHIEHVESAVKLTQDAILKQSAHFASFAKVEGTHFDLLRNALSAENHTIANLFKAVRSLARVDGEQRPYLAQALQMIRMFVNMHDQTYELLDAIESLAQGSISPALIKPAVVAKVLHYVSNEIHDSYGAHLVWTNEQDFYRTKRFAYHRVGLNLHLRVGFPISFMDDESRLYAVTTFPMSVPNNTLTTHLADQPTYFLTVDNHTRRRRTNTATSTNTAPNPSYFEYFAEFYEMPHLDEDDLLDLTEATVTLRPISATTCLSAIFLNQVNSINAICPFRATPGPLPPNTIEIAPATVLLQNITSYNQICSDDTGTHTITTPGCNDTCIVTLPCRCSILTNVAYIPKRFSGCLNDTNVTMVHTVNLHALSLFFDKDDLIDIHAASTFNSTPRIDFPDLSPLYVNLSSDDTVKYQIDDVSLTKIAATAHLEAVTYSALIDGALAGESTMPFSYSYTHQLWWYANLIGLTILALCVCTTIWLTHRVRHLSLIVTALRMVRPAGGLQLTYTRASPTPPPENTMDMVNDYHNASESTFSKFSQLWYAQWTNLAVDEVKLLQLIVALLIITGLIKTLIYLKRHWLQPSTNWFFALEFGTQKLSTVIPLIPLPHPMDYYTFHEGKGLHAANVIGLLRPKLHLTWPDLTITDTTTTLTTFPNVTAIPSLSWQQAKLCRQIICLNYYVIPCTCKVNHDHRYLQWADDSSPTTPTALTRPPARLYPALPAH